MWILRFHLLKTKHYNKLSRICKKYGFIPRKHSSLVYCKAIVKHITQKTSYRALGREFGIDHISLYHFHENAKKSGLLAEIFHVFIEERFSLYIGDKRHISGQDLNNSQEIYDLTCKELESIFKGL